VKYVYADNYEGSPINVMIAQREWGEQEIPLGMLKLSMTLTQGSTEYNKPLRIPSMTSNVNSLLTSRGSLHCGDGQSSGYPKPQDAAWPGTSSSGITCMPLARAYLQSFIQLTSGTPDGRGPNVIK
jgi:hypothetical protein